ncbi:porin [Phaeovibrio sulfidiphilus]|uniref:Porin n=1 Tax=Phaeovibrio sulfidiphilus TaxID=1220600 RepID=A0A8J6YMA0_9PROT|nr:porin [Phaeovibrio sulfidiphilus]MBE1237273.1 porin [Phaeovibrio sulfidiphilus]
MKRVLIGATALIGAQIASPAMAAEKIQLELGGYMEQFFGGVKAIKDGNLGGGSSGFGMDRETRVFVQGKTNLDNGITVGAHINLRAEGSNMQVNTKRQYAWMSGDFGWFGIGEQNGVVDRFAVTAPDQGGRNNHELLDWMNFAYTGAGKKGHTHRIPTLKSFIDDNSLRVMYITPSFHGFSAGVSYAPWAEVNRNSGVRVREKREGSNEVQVGVAYTGSLGEIETKWDASLSTTIDGVDRWLYRSGLSFGYAGWTVGGAYLGTSSSESKRGNVWNGSANHIFNENLMELGARYLFGPYGLSMTYGQNVSSQGKAMMAHAAGTYEMGPGVTLIGQLFYGESDGKINYDTGHGSSTYRNGVGAVSAILLKF